MVYSKEVLTLICNLFFFFRVEGTRPTTRDVGKIDFRAVHVVAQVVPDADRGSLPSNRVAAIAGGHLSLRIGPASLGALGAQELVREDPSFRCWDAGQDQKWRH